MMTRFSISREPEKAPDGQVVLGLEDGELLLERPSDKSNPAIEVQERLPDGTEFKAVWSHLKRSGVAKLVTVHFFDEV